jgi:hypothetical protein
MPAAYPEVTMNRLHESNGQVHDGGCPPSPPSAAVGNGGDRSSRGRFQAGHKAGQATRFAKGNKAAVGHVNAFQRQLGRIRLALATALTDEDVRAIVAALVQMVVQHHSIEAVRFLFDYLVGPPLQHNTDPDTLDGDELQKLRLEGQADAMGNSRLPPSVALLIEKVYADLAAAEVVGLDLDDGGTGLGQRLLAALKDAGLADLAWAAKGYCDRMQALAKGSEAEQRTNG